MSNIFGPKLKEKYNLRRCKFVRHNDFFKLNCYNYKVMKFIRVRDDIECFIQSDVS